MQMLKTLTVYNLPAHGHVNPTLPIVQALVRDGVRVIYYNTSAYRATIEATGAEFRAYPIDATLEQTFANPPDTIPKTSMALLQATEVMFEPLLAQLKTDQSDLCLVDSLACWGKWVAQAAGVPFVCSISTFAFNTQIGPMLGWRLLMQMVTQVVQVVPEFAQRALRLRRLGIRDASPLGAVMTSGPYNIVYTSRLLQPSPEKLVGRYEFIGASINPRSPDPSLNMAAIARRPLVYISLGTIFNDRPAFYRACLAQFADHAGQFIMSVGKTLDIAQLGTIPDNFIVRAFVPQLDVLAHADAFITHGGMNSAHESLCAGVPMVLIPQQSEQAMVAQQVHNAGAGVALMPTQSFGDATPSAVSAALAQVLGNPSYRQNAERVGTDLRDGGGPTRAAQLIAQYAQNPV
jgi:MGT family glycosyltransferase